MRLFFLFIALGFSGVSNAAAYSWISPTNANIYGDSPMAACIKFNSGNATGMTFQMSASGIDGSCLYNGANFYGNYIQRTGTTCPVSGQTYSTSTGTCSCLAPKVMQGGQCVTPAPVDPCTSKSGLSTGYVQKWSSFESYSSNCKVSVDGCQVDRCSGSSQCGANAQGEYACWGTGSYTGITSPGTDEPTVDSDETDAPEPLVSTSNQNCQPNGNGGFTCVTSSSSQEFASSQCTVGSTGGATGYVCVKPDYVPEAATTTQTVETGVTQNQDGSTTTTTTTTTDNTYCKGGGCTTTTTTQTGTKTTDGNGNTVSESSECTGPNCEAPTDETGPEEEETFSSPGSYTGPDTSDAFPELAEVPSYSETMENFQGRVSASPIIGGLSSISVPSGGSCDIGSASLFGGTISFNHFCDIAPTVLSGLRYLFLAIWAWAAIRLFFTA